MKIKDVHTIVQKWLYLKSTNRIDLPLAVHLTTKIPGTKIWMIYIGGSGATKSELIRALDDNGKTTYILQEITPNTLVSGSFGAEDLAPQLNFKDVLIVDGAILLNLKRDDKAKIWAQCRELYDGNARKVTGSGKKGSAYSNLNVTLQMCSTTAIDNQILIHQNLGTRELLYRINPIEEKKEEDAIMKAVENNEKHEEQMRTEIKKAFQKFLKGRKYKDIPLSEEVREKIHEHVRYLRVMRTSVAFDSYTGELISTAEPEHPTRILKQLIRLYKALKSLDDDYTDKKALEVIKEVRDSSCDRDRIKVMKVLASEPTKKFSVTSISQAVRLGKSSVTRHLNALWNLRLIHRHDTEIDNGRAVFTWSANENHHVTKTIIKEVTNLSSDEIPE